MDFHLLEPEQVRIATAAGLGSFVYLMVTRNLGWIYVLSLFAVGQFTAFYFTVPVAAWRGWSMATYGLLAFVIGAMGMLLWSTVIKIANNLHDDPWGTASRAWKLWRGGSSDSGGKA